MLPPAGQAGGPRNRKIFFGNRFLYQKPYFKGVAGMIRPFFCKMTEPSGGGSFNIGTSQTSAVYENGNDGQGKVIITLL